MSDAPGERRVFVTECRGVRVQRFGAALATTKLVGQLGATVAVLVGVMGVAALITPAATAVLVLAVILIGLASLVSVPLLLALAPTWLVALATLNRPAALRAGRSLRIERGEAVEAFSPATVVSVSREPSTPGLVVIRLENGDVIRAALEGEDGLDQLVDAVVQGGTRGPWVARVHHSKLPPTWPRWTAIAITALGALAMAAFGHGSEAAACVVGGLGLLAWLTFLRPGPVQRNVVVGSDGIAIRSDVYDRFIPFSRITAVEPHDLGATLVLEGGERIELAVVPPGLLTASDGTAAKLHLAEQRRATLLARLTAGMSAVEALAGEERLSRQGRTMRAWREAVCEVVVEDAPGYRAAVLSTEQAARIVENGHAAPEARIGAALALSARASQATKQRLRIAIEDCADEATQLAIEQALEDRLDPWTLDRAERARSRK